MKLFRSCRIGLMGLILGLAAYGQNSQITIDTVEQLSFRRVTVELPGNISDDGYRMLIPKIVDNPETGVIDVVFKYMKETDFSGEMIRKDIGRFPIRYMLNFPDDSTMEIKIETIPFEKFNTVLAYGEHRYHIDIFYPGQPVTPEPSVTEEINSPSSSNVQALVVERAEEKPKSKGLLVRALKVAGFITIILAVLTLLTVYILKIYKGTDSLTSKYRNQPTAPRRGRIESQDSRPSFQQVQQKAIMNIKRPKPPESQKDVSEPDDVEINSEPRITTDQYIRVLMEKKNLTYDEAVMFYNLNQNS